MIKLWHDAGKTVLDLTCDRDHGFLDAPSAQFRGDYYSQARALASAAGWRISSGARAVSCPYHRAGE
jgi:hypothetical protein